jgi:hypothetical protein
MAPATLIQRTANTTPETTGVDWGGAAGGPSALPRIAELGVIYRGRDSRAIHYTPAGRSAHLLAILPEHPAEQSEPTTERDRLLVAPLRCRSLSSPQLSA